MINYRPILYVNGILLSILAGVMVLPMFADLIADHPDWQVFAISAFICGFCGGMLCFTTRQEERTLSLRDSFLLTASCYLIVTIAASVPLYLSDLQLTYTDAFFEASSGITATGSTVLVGLDSMPPGILLWRSLINGLGGLGVVVLAMAVLPMLNIGGMQLFKSESSETAEKMLPRARQIAGVIAGVFGTLVLFCMIGYWLAGMAPFDAMNHALTTVATAGFSTHDASLGYYDSLSIELVAICFMLLSALPFILIYQTLQGDGRPFWKNSQVQFFLMTVGIVIAAAVLWLVWVQEYPLGQALREASFNVIAIITTTGYASADYSQWGSFPVVLLFMAIVLGGCTGSTTGGIKTFRIQILYKTAKVHIERLIQPSGVFVPHYEGKRIPDSVSQSVMSFILLFAFSFVVLAMILSTYGLDFLTAMSAAAQALSNVGPGLGSVIGPYGNYVLLPDGAKWWLAFAFIAGRLELFTVLVLLSPRFWKG